MIGRMPLLHRDKRPPASSAYLVIRDQLGLDRRAILSRFDHAGSQMYRRITRRRPQQLDVKIGGHGTIRRALIVAFHQEIRGSPIRMTIQQNANNAAIQHPGKRLMMRLGVPCRYYFIAVRKAVDMQSFLIRRPTAKADALWRVPFLQR